MAINIKQKWLMIQNKSEQIYGGAKQVYNNIKKNITGEKAPDALLKRITCEKRVKPVHAALALTLLAGMAFSTLPLPAGKKPQAKLKTASGLDDAGGTHASKGQVSSDDRYLLARVIEGEAANEPMTGKVAVGAVIINRTRSEEFPRDVRQVVYQPLAFEAVANGQYNRPLTPEALEAADAALSGVDPTNGALYYWNPAKSSSEWVWQRQVTMQIGRHVFAR